MVVALFHGTPEQYELVVRYYDNRRRESLARKCRITVREGETLEVLVNPGYVGLEFHNDQVGFYLELPRDKMVPLLRWLVPLVKQMPSSVDPILHLREQAAVDDAQSRQRRQRRRSPRRPQKRKR
jgi:hypothetical protein